MARAHRSYKERHARKYRDFVLRKDHGIGVDEVERLENEQDGCCAICRLPERDIHNVTRKVKNLAVDHDHKTGLIRGLLCAKCNRGLGMFLDNPTLLRAAADYVERHGGAAFDIFADIRLPRSASILQ